VQLCILFFSVSRRGFTNTRRVYALNVDFKCLEKKLLYKKNSK